MGGDRQLYRLPLRAEHVQVLDWYVTALEDRSTREWSGPIARGHTEQVRLLANRMAERIAGFATDDALGFSAADVALLTEMAERLITSAESLLGSPNLAADEQLHARRRLAIGRTILEARDRVREQLSA
jgi:hypothetical protein